MGKYLNGIYKPTNPQKYKGDVKNIVYRSSWELTYLRELDRDDKVLQYSSEEIIIPYHNPVSKTVRRYFMDFWVKYIDHEGNIREKLVEIKPHTQTLPPVKGKKKQRTMLNEALTYETNQAKWAAADTYCKKKGWHFEIRTEKGVQRRV